MRRKHLLPVMFLLALAFPGRALAINVDVDLSLCGSFTPVCEWDFDNNGVVDATGCSDQTTMYGTTGMKTAKVTVTCGQIKQIGTVNLDAYSYSWQTSSWSLCSGSPANQSRTVTCRRNDGATVADSFCDAGTKPSATLACTYAYSGWSGWSSCSASCGGGTQSQTRTCIQSDGQTVNCSYCGGTCSQSQACNTQACGTVCGGWQPGYGCRAAFSANLGPGSMTGGTQSSCQAACQTGRYGCCWFGTGYCGGDDAAGLTYHGGDNQGATCY